MCRVVGKYYSAQGMNVFLPHEQADEDGYSSYRYTASRKQPVQLSRDGNLDLDTGLKGDGGLERVC